MMKARSLSAFSIDSWEASCRYVQCQIPQTVTICVKADQIKNSLSHFALCFLHQDSLSKFVGRTLKDCGEDLLVEISEILFNELAFFRLMQDLDNNSNIALAAKHKNKKRADQPSKANPGVKVSLYFCHFPLCFW